MTQRFGRNRRRAAREAIAALERERNTFAVRARRAEVRVATAEEDGMNRILRERHLPLAIDQLSRHLAREMGPELGAEAVKLLALGQRQHGERALPRLEARVPLDASFAVTEVQFHVPSFTAAIRVANY